MFTIAPPRPCSTITRATDWATRNMPRRLTATIRSHSSVVRSRNGLRQAVPALLTRTSIPPRWDSAAVTSSATPLGSLTSTLTPDTSPIRRRSSTVPRTCSSSRPPTVTRQPSCRKRSAVARPMPLLPPETSTRLSRRPRMVLLVGGVTYDISNTVRYMENASQQAPLMSKDTGGSMGRAVPAANRALDILELFLDAPVLSAPEVVTRLGLPRTTVHELLGTLVDRSYLVVMPGQPLRYRLGVRLFQLGSVFAENLDLAREAQRVAAEVAASCDETVHVAVLEGRDAFYIARIDSTHPVRMVSAVGRRLPAHCTGVGKMLLSSLAPEVVDALYPPSTRLETMTSKSISSRSKLNAEL